MCLEIYVCVYVFEEEMNPHPRDRRFIKSGRVILLMTWETSAGSRRDAPVSNESRKMYWWRFEYITIDTLYPSRWFPPFFIRCKTPKPNMDKWQSREMFAARWNETRRLRTLGTFHKSPLLLLPWLVRWIKSNHAISHPQNATTSSFRFNFHILSIFIHRH